MACGFGVSAFAATERACLEVGWLFRRTGGPAATLAANVRWLAGYRHARCLRDDAAETLIQVFTEPKPLMRGTHLAGDPIAVLPVLYHLLWKHMLVTEMEQSLLGPGSMVSRKEGATR